MKQRNAFGARSLTHLCLPRDGGPVPGLEVEVALADALQDDLGAVAGAVGEGGRAAKRNGSDYHDVLLIQSIPCSLWEYL